MDYVIVESSLTRPRKTRILKNYESLLVSALQISKKIRKLRKSKANK